LGEAAAAEFLCRRGARILGRNLRAGVGEIDLLVGFGSLLVAVEVKTRVSCDPVEQFTEVKAARLRRAGWQLSPSPSRFDLVAVRICESGMDLRWIPGIC
jgi:putative endonuclease